MGNYFTSTLKTNDFGNKDPFRDALERYRKEKFSQTTFNKINNVWKNQMNNQWVVSGTSMLDDWLAMTPQGNSFIEKVSKDIDMKRSYYYG